MTDVSTELPPLKTAERYLQLELDTFCVECGYNLHGQPVSRDQRLGIFVCRCPECGRFHPAGAGLTAARPWMNRLSMGLMVLWVLFVLHAIFWIVMGMGVIGVVHTSEGVNRKLVTMDGQSAEWYIAPTGQRSMVHKGTTQPVMQWRSIYTLEEATENPAAPGWGGSNRRQYFDWWVFAAMTGAAAGLGLVTGMLMVTFLWHWSRRGYRLALLLPFAVATVVSVFMIFEAMYVEILTWAVRVVFAYALLQALFMALGIKLGRPMARGLLRMFIPPRPRQHFAFLWRVDGKSPPQAAG